MPSKNSVFLKKISQKSLFFKKYCARKITLGGKNHQINFNHPDLIIKLHFAIIGFSEGLFITNPNFQHILDTSNLDENWCRSIFWEVDYDFRAFEHLSTNFRTKFWLFWFPKFLIFFRKDDHRQTILKNWRHICNRRTIKRIGSKFMQIE